MQEYFKGHIETTKQNYKNKIIKTIEQYEDIVFVLKDITTTTKKMDRHLKI